MSGLICPKLYFWGKIFKFHAKIAKMDSIVVYVIHICSCISVKFCTVLLHKFPKDIIFDIKLKRSKISKFGTNNCYNANKSNKVPTFEFFGGKASNSVQK